MVASGLNPAKKQGALIHTAFLFDVSDIIAAVYWMLSKRGSFAVSIRG